MTKFLYVLVAILSALVTVWCSLGWTLCIAFFLGFSLLALLLLLQQRQVGGVRVRQEKKWSADNINDSTLEKVHKENNSIVDQEDNNSYRGHSYLKRKSSVNRTKDHDENLGSESEDEEIPGSVFSTTNTGTTTIISIMSNLEKSISNSRLMSSLFSVFNKGSNSENDRPVSPPGRHNNKERKNGREANTNNRRRMAVVGGDGRTTHMSPSLGCGISTRSDTSPRIIGSPLSRGRINTGYYEIGRTTVVRHGGSNRSSMIIHPQRRHGRFAKSPVKPSSSSPLSTSPLPRFHRTACESPDRPGINPVGFTPHTLQRPEVCYPSNSSPGILPHVRLEKRIKIPLIESNMNKMKSPVTVRIAPPEMGVHHSPKFTSLKQNLNFPLTPDTNDVLSALREGTRKRTNVCGSDEDSIFESANNTAKRRRQESNHSTASSSSMPSLPDFLPDLSHCNFTPSSYMSPTSRYMVPSSSGVNSGNSGTVTYSPPGMMGGSSGVNSGVKRPVAPCAHLSQAENSPNSKRARQEVKNNPILSSLSSSQRYWLHQKDPIKRKFLDSSELQDSFTSKENQDANSSDSQQSEKPASKLSRSITESANSDTEANQTSVSMATPDHQSEETQANTNSSESKTTPDLRSRRKHLSFATPSINLDRLSYANVYATKQDYENDRKAEQERVEKMLDRIATEKKTPDADLLSQKNVVGSSEDGHQPTSVLTVSPTTQSSTSPALTCTTAATSLIVSSTAASLTSSSSISSSLLAPKTTSSESLSSTSATSTTQAVSSSIFSSSTPTTTKAVLPSASPLSSLLQAPSTSTSTLATPSSTTSLSTTVPQTTTAGLLASSTKPTETSISLTSTASATTSAPPFQPMFGSPAAATTTTTSANTPNIGGLQFEIKTASASSSIPSTTSSGFNLGTFNMAGSTSATSAPASTTASGFAFGISAVSPQTTATIPTPAATTNAGSLPFSSPGKDLSKPGGFSFNLINPQATPTSPAAQKPHSQPAASPFSTPKILNPSTTSSSSPLFPFTSTSAQTFTTASTTSTSLPFGTAAVTAPSAAASTTPAPGVFAFVKSTTPASLPQSSTPASSTIPTTGMFAFKPSDTAISKPSAASIPTSNPTTGIFAFKATADSTSAVTTQASTDQGFIFGASGTNTKPPAFGSSNKPPPVFGASTSTSTFGSASSNFGATAATGAPKFGATSTNAPAFNATSSAPPPAFGAATIPAFGAATTPAFGAATTPAFGATTTPAFGATTTPAFGATTTPAFGATTTPAFGATTTTFGTTSPSPAFGTTSSTSTPVFGASPASTTTAFAPPSSATSPLFSSTDKSKPAFGATSSPFSTSSTASTAFGGSTTAFGAPSNTNTLFGASASQNTQANTSRTGAFAFDSNSNTARQTSTTSAPMTGFNFAFNSAPASQNTFAFGGSTSSSTTTTAGTTTTTTISTTASKVAAGSTSIFGQASSNFGGFSSAGQDGQKSMFGSPSTNQSGFNYSATSANQTTSVFGQTGQQPQASQPFTFGQGSTAGNTSTPFGQSSAFSSPQASSFGSFGAKPTNVFAAPTNNSDKASQPTPNIFGSAAPASAATPPNVASQPFGAASRTPSTAGNTGLFGTTATGQASTSAGGSTAAPGIFTFGQSPGTQQPTAATTTTNPSQGFDFSASLGGTSQFNFGQGGGAPSKSTMFNMGSGSTAPKMRSFYPKARRRGAKK